MLTHFLVETLDEVGDVSAEFLVEPVPLGDLRDLRLQPLDLGLRGEELVGGAVGVGLVPPVHLVHRLDSGKNQSCNQNYLMMSTEYNLRFLIPFSFPLCPHFHATSLSSYFICFSRTPSKVDVINGS